MPSWASPATRATRGMPRWGRQVSAGPTSSRSRREHGKGPSIDGGLGIARKLCSGVSRWLRGQRWVKSFGVVFFRSGGDGGQGGAAAVAAGVVGVEHVGQALQGGLGEVSAFSVLPLLVLFEQDGSDQAGDGVAVGEDLDDVCAALDLAVEALDGVVGPDLGPVLPGADGSWRRPLGPARRRPASERSRGRRPSKCR